jgi:hypothetical protein
LTEEIRRRLELAQAIAPVYAADRDVAAVIVGGSVARGTADRFSDLELGIFWATDPTAERCAALAAQAGATGHRAYPPAPGSDWWEEECTVDGLKVDLLHATVGTTERLLADVTRRHDTTPTKLVITGVIQGAIPLAGQPLVERWRRAATYPDGLAVAVVRAHLGFGPTSYLRMLAERGDVLLLYDLFGRAVAMLIAILQGLNRVYPPSTDLKWLRWVADQIPVSPDRFLDRCECLFHDDPVSTVDELHALIEETLALVEAALPDIDTGPVRDRIAQRRQVW